jgi:hypothetical protein
VKLRFALILTFVLLATPALAQKVYIDYDQAYDFDTMETFAWQDTPETSMSQSNPLMHSRLVNGIEHYLTVGGIREDNDDPDVYVTYHTSSEQKTSISTSDWGYGYPNSWYHGGYYGRYGGYGGYGMSMGMSTSTVHTYETGTLVIDVWDVSTKQLVWRGMAANITVVDNPGKMGKKLDKALKKIVGKSKKIRAKDSKGK